MKNYIQGRGILGTSPVVQWLGICLPMQGIRVSSLVEELRSHTSLGVTKLHATTPEPRRPAARGPQREALASQPRPKAAK